MVEKFTLRSLDASLRRLTLLLLMVVSSTLFTRAQQDNRVNGQAAAERKARIAQKLSQDRGRRTTTNAPVTANNDMGLPNETVSRRMVRTSRTEAICTTFTGSLAPGDLTMSNRVFRDVDQGVCPGPKPFPGSLAANTYYDTYIWVNNSGLDQCATFELSTTDVTANIQLAVYNGSFDPANLATNFLTDPGISTGTPPDPTSCSVNVTAGQLLVLVVFSPNTLQTASNYMLTVDLPVCSGPACSAAPTPGNTLSSTPSACPGVNFSLTVENPTAGSGVSYQWQKASSASGPWTDISGGIGASLTTSQTTATCYRCNVTCAGNGTASSTPVCVAIAPPTSCYCIPPATDCSFDDLILRVRLSTLDNASDCGTGPPDGYTDYTSTVSAPFIYSGAANTIMVDVPTIFTEQLAVWIDYDRNGMFDAAEFTNLGSNTGTTGILSRVINIPSTVASGLTRMRIRVRFSTPLGSGDACTGYTFGETEDYNVDIQPCVPVTVTGNPANTSTYCGGNASFTVTTAGSMPAFSWQYRTSSSGSWQTVPDAIPYSGVYTSTLVLSNVSQDYNGYQFRALVSGGCSAVDFSGAGTLTVTPIIPVVDPAAPAICTGSVQQLTLTNTTPEIVLLNEGWRTVSPLPANWFSQNNSSPIGTTGWFQGNPAVFNAHSGAVNGYIGANFRNASGTGTISNWLLTPELSIKNGDVFTFWTRTVDGTNFPDRLELRLSTAGTSTNVGASSTSVGDFTTLLLTINPTLTTTDYPEVWTEYTATVSGLAAPASGRFAFRYFVTDGGTTGDNSNYIGIDDVKFTSVSAPALGTWTGNAGTMWSDAGATIPYSGTPANTIWVTPTVTSTYGVTYNTITPCTSANTNVTVKVYEPAVLVSSPADVAVCIGGSTTLTVSATGGPLTYQWQRSTDGGLSYSDITGATASALNITGVTLAMNGYRYRCVIGATPCPGSITSASATVSVLSLPVVTLSSPDLLIIPGSNNETSITASSTPAGVAGSWVWTYNGNVISGITSNTVTGIGVDELGTYRATVTDINGCKATSAPLVIGAEGSDRLWIYPNPSEGQFQVRLYYDPASLADIRGVYIYNAQGQLVDKKEFVLYNSAPYLRMDFDLGRQADGTYVVKVIHKHAGTVTTGLLVKQSR